RVIVYNSLRHSYKDNTYKGVDIIHKCLPDSWLGTGSQYIYDLFCLRDAIRLKADVIIECGYASAAPWYKVLRRGGIKLVTHMDGMEWKREKWNALTKNIFLRAENLAVRYSDVIVCDHPVIGDYYREMYSVSPEIIPYGAEIRKDFDLSILDELGLKSGSYYLLIARLEPENNIRMIIEGFLASGAGESLVVVGDYSGKHGRQIFRDFGNNKRLRFIGGVFDPKLLDHLRHYSKAYFHGHSVGGTNPSLLEAMAAGALVIAHDNPYNRWVLGENGGYFRYADEVTEHIIGIGKLERERDKYCRNNIERIRTDFQWDSVVNQYEQLFTRLIGSAD
ncbi:DUF1972 domain-containing protein, partial [Bacteroidota bacterium]